MSVSLFPYAFRENQREALRYLEGGIASSNLLLDAPTGFGKTPLILAALLQADEGRIIWAVKTGNETDRPVEELKVMSREAGESIFGLSFRGKRDMCLLAREKDIASYEGVSYLCKQKRDECSYHSSLDRLPVESIISQPRLYSEIMDLCSEAEVCPYYAQRRLVPYARLVSLSYNYVIHEGISWSIRRLIPFRSSYVVVDEAHNLRRAGNLYSDSITLGTMRFAVKELDQFHSTRSKQIERYIQDMLEAAEEVYDGMMEEDRQQVELDVQGFLARVEDRHQDYLGSMKRYGGIIHRRQLREGKSPHSSLHHLSQFWLDSLPVLEEKGVAFIATRKDGNLKIERWDMRSGEILKSRWGIFKRCLFCSGTLRPFKAFAKMVGLSDWRAKAFESNFGKESRTFLVRGLTAKGKKLSSDQVDSYLQALDCFLGLDVNVAIFSASYRIQKALLRGGLEDMVTQRGRQLFLEQAGMRGDHAREMLDGFKSSSTGVLCATARGRFAEGADFPGEELEGVFLVGVPFDRMNVHTRLYLDYYKSLYGKEEGTYLGYVVPALKRASQAIGRALRSEEDRAIFILGDERYENEAFFRLLPHYIRENLEIIHAADLKEELERAEKKVFTASSPD